jgi:hypothetical protein
MGVSGQRQAPAALPSGKTRYLYRRLSGYQGGSGRMKKISTPPGFNPRNVQPVASRYADVVQNLLSSNLLSKNITIKISRTTILSVFLRVWNLVAHIEEEK